MSECEKRVVGFTL